MKKQLTLLIISFCLHLAATSTALAQAGSLDTTFSGDGIETTVFGTSVSYGTAVVIQPDGKIVGAGRRGTSTSTNGIDFALARYNTNGTMDISFGTSGNGKVTTNIGNSNYDNKINAMAIQTDGKLVVAGETEKSTPGNAFVVARYSTNGTLDSTFGIDGSVILPLALTPYNASSRAVIIQPDGKIVVGGGVATTGINTGFDFTLVRLDTTGNLDTTFDADGIVTIDITGGDDECTSLVQQPDGKIVASGYAGNLGTRDFALLRFNTNGSLDTTFDTDGIVTTTIGNNDIFFSVALNSQNKIIAGGTESFNTFIVAQYNTNGSLDLSFSGDGIAFTFIGITAVGRSLAIQNNDKIVIAGNGRPVSNHDFGLIRYNTNGSLDATFGTGGIVTTNFSGFDDSGYSLALQTDGKMVVFGESYYNPQTGYFGIARYNGDCSANAFSQSPVICAGQSITVGSNTYTASGTYSDTLTTTSGCDSIVTTNLTVNPNILSSQNITICIGQSVTVGSNTYTSQGTYTDVLNAANGCDSIVTTNLTVNANSVFSQTLTINIGDSVVVGNSAYFTAGVYVDTLIAANGCDSIVTTNLTVLTGIKENSFQENQPYIYPNPAQNQFTVHGLQFTIGDVLLLSDLLGKPVIKETISSPTTNFKLQTSNLSAGMYLLTVKTKAGIIERKVVVQR